MEAKTNYLKQAMQAQNGLKKALDAFVTIEYPTNGIYVVLGLVLDTAKGVWQVIRRDAYKVQSPYDMQEIDEMMQAMELLSNLNHAISKRITAIITGNEDAEAKALDEVNSVINAMAGVPSVNGFNGLNSVFHEVAHSNTYITISEVARLAKAGASLDEIDNVVWGAGVFAEISDAYLSVSLASNEINQIAK
jgi:hypothetical protein